MAFGITINSDIAEAIQAGDRVDLLVTLTPTDAAGGNGGPQPVTQKTLENILILQVGPWPADVGDQASTQGGGGSPQVVTLQMTEQDALALKHIETTSTNYSFVLRAANDEDLFTTEPVTIEYLNKRFNFNIPGLGQ